MPGKWHSILAKSFAEDTIHYYYNTVLIMAIIAIILAVVGKNLSCGRLQRSNDIARNYVGGQISVCVNGFWTLSELLSL